MPPALNFSYYFFPTSFIMLNIFFHESTLYTCFIPRLDSACGGQGRHFPLSTKWKSQVPEATQCIFFLRASVHGLQSVLLSLREIRGKHGRRWSGKTSRRRFGGGHKGRKSKAQSSQTQMRIQSWIPFHTLPVFFFCLIFFILACFTLQHAYESFISHVQVLLNFLPFPAVMQAPWGRNFCLLCQLIALISRAVPGTQQVLNKCPEVPGKWQKLLTFIHIPIGIIFNFTRKSPLLYLT